MAVSILRDNHAPAELAWHPSLSKKVVLTVALVKFLSSIPCDLGQTAIARLSCKGVSQWTANLIDIWKDVELLLLMDGESSKPG